MKFKAQDKQNQLIENITVNHLVVGVDIAQETHVARAVNFRGIALGHPLEFSNDEAGFRSLYRWIQDLHTSHRLTTTMVGMEPTGHYWLSLAHWLEEMQIDAVLVNPHLVKKNKENRDNTRSKSDKKDAWSLQIWWKTATIPPSVQLQKLLKNYAYLWLTAIQS